MFSFPVSFKENFKLVDIWMLKKRNEEQIELCKREMFQFLKSIARDIDSRQEEIKTLKETSLASSENNGSNSLFIHGKTLIKLSEIRRLKMLMNDALKYQKISEKEMV